MKVNWIVDEKAEFQLRKLGIGFERALVKISLIDRKASAENRARDVPLDTERVQLIKIAMDAGVPMPSIVLRLRRDGRYVIAGGNHRFNATLATEDAQLIAYVITCTDVEFETLCKQLNTVEGVGSRLEERLSWAAKDILREGISKADAAERYNVVPHSVGTALRLLKAQTRLDSMGARGSILKQAHVVALGDLVNNDNILNAAVECIAQGATGKELKEIANRARSLGTEAEQVQCFAEAAAVKAELARKPIKRTKRSAFLAWVTTGEKIACKAKTLEELEILELELTSVKERIESLAKCLNCLCRGSG
jgi:ParB-like chromosome segregation protein Spo0J